MQTSEICMFDLNLHTLVRKTRKDTYIGICISENLKSLGSNLNQKLVIDCFFELLNPESKYQNSVMNYCMSALSASDVACSFGSCNKVIDIVKHLRLPFFGICIIFFICPRYQKNPVNFISDFQKEKHQKL